MSCQGIVKKDLITINETTDSAVNRTIVDAVLEVQRSDPAIDISALTTNKFFQLSGEGHALCDSGKSWINPISVVDREHSFHPNKKGQKAFRDAVTEKLGSFKRTGK